MPSDHLRLKRRSERTRGLELIRHYFNHGVGRDGREVPMHPELLSLPWWCWPLCVLGLAAAINGRALGRSWESFGDPAFWERVLAILPLLLFISTVGVAVIILAPLLFWPLTRRTLGRALEAQVDEWPVERLEEQITRDAQTWRTAPESRKPGYRRRVAWLYAKREELHGLPTPAPMAHELADAEA